ncbi:hypothetical protein SprV_0200536700 [Sparganum proliferum]
MPPCVEFPWQYEPPSAAVATTTTTTTAVPSVSPQQPTDVEPSATASGIQTGVKTGEPDMAASSVPFETSAIPPSASSSRASGGEVTAVPPTGVPQTPSAETKRIDEPTSKVSTETPTSNIRRPPTLLDAAHARRPVALLFCHAPALWYATATLCSSRAASATANI